ncbi:MAG: hypothetical protein WAU69_15455 [Solirubrobacteraceae bacterium]
MDLFELGQVVSIARTTGETLEGDDAAESCDAELDAPVIGEHRTSLDRLVVERGESAADDVNQAGRSARSQMRPSCQVLIRDGLAAIDSHAIQSCSSSGSIAGTCSLDGSQQRRRLRR